MVVPSSVGVRQPHRQAAAACFGFTLIAGAALAYQGVITDVSSAVPTPAVAAVVVSSSGDERISVEGDNAVLFCMSLLEKGEQTLEAMQDYTALFLKQECIDGKLSEQNQIQLKVRCAPFSVYMKWQTPNAGRETIYVDGENDGKMLVHDGGSLASFLIPVLRLDPNGDLARRYSRHPVTEIGLLNLTRRLLDYRKQDLRNADVRVRMSEDAQVDGRPCYQFEFTYPKGLPGVSYHKVVACIDKEWRIPLACTMYDWPSAEAPDTPVLVEHYTYTQLKFNQSLTSVAFDHQNPEYGYRRL